MSLEILRLPAAVAGPVASDLGVQVPLCKSYTRTHRIEIGIPCLSLCNSVCIHIHRSRFHERLYRFELGSDPFESRTRTVIRSFGRLLACARPGEAAGPVLILTKLDQLMIDGHHPIHSVSDQPIN